MNYLNDKFESFIKAAYGSRLDPKSAQHSDLKDAFYGGALVIFVKVHNLAALPEEQALNLLHQLQQELAAHKGHAQAAADLYRDIMEAGGEKQ